MLYRLFKYKSYFFTPQILGTAEMKNQFQFHFRICRCIHCWSRVGGHSQLDYSVLTDCVYCVCRMGRLYNIWNGKTGFMILVSSVCVQRRKKLSRVLIYVIAK